MNDRAWGRRERLVRCDVVTEPGLTEHRQIIRQGSERDAAEWSWPMGEASWPGHGAGAQTGWIARTSRSLRAVGMAKTNGDASERNLT